MISTETVTVNDISAGTGFGDTDTDLIVSVPAAFGDEACHMMSDTTNKPMPNNKSAREKRKFTLGDSIRMY